jgi:peptide/nickel transport system permease protein
VSGLSQFGAAVPAFLVGILLVEIFAVSLRILPSGGWTPPDADPVAFLKCLVLPALSLGLMQAAVLTRYVRSAVLDVLGEDYLRTARAKGLTRREALVRHGFRYGAIPVLTVLGLEIPSLIVGAVVIENVFTLPGIGTLLLQAEQNRDLIVVQDVVMLVAVTVLVVNFLVDVSYRVLDPRLARA